jgi:hypothetical protein
MLKEKRAHVPLIPRINHIIEEGSKESFARRENVSITVEVIDKDP